MVNANSPYSPQTHPLDTALPQATLKPKRVSTFPGSQIHTLCLSQAWAGGRATWVPWEGKEGKTITQKLPLCSLLPPTLNTTSWHQSSNYHQHGQGLSSRDLTFFTERETEVQTCPKLPRKLESEKAAGSIFPHVFSILDLECDISSGRESHPLKIRAGKKRTSGFSGTLLFKCFISNISFMPLP